MRDGCYLADKALGGKSSCSECPFSDCVLSERECAVSEGLHGVELEQSRIAGVNEADLRKAFEEKFRSDLMFEGFRHRWLKDARGCGEGRIKDSMLRGFSVVCSDCGRWLNRYDEIYKRKGDTSGRYWCPSCCVLEVLSLLYIRRCLRIRMINLRSYERVWRGVISDT